MDPISNGPSPIIPDPNTVGTEMANRERQEVFNENMKEFERIFNEGNQDMTAEGNAGNTSNLLGGDAFDGVLSRLADKS